MSVELKQYDFQSNPIYAIVENYDEDQDFAKNMKVSYIQIYNLLKFGTQVAFSRHLQVCDNFR